MAILALFVFGALWIYFVVNILRVNTRSHELILFSHSLFYFYLLDVFWLHWKLQKNKIKWGTAKTVIYDTKLLELGGFPLMPFHVYQNKNTFTNKFYSL